MFVSLYVRGYFQNYTSEFKISSTIMKLHVILEYFIMIKMLFCKKSR